MKISIEKEVFSRFNRDFQAALILFTGIDNKSQLKESKQLLGEVEHLIKLTFNKDTVKTHHLISPWNVAKQEFGKKAKHYHTSVEKLLKEVLSGKSVATNNVLTNLGRYLALKYIIPVGLDDVRKIQGEMTFAVAGSPAEKKSRLGKPKLSGKALPQGELFYHDEQKILGTKLDYWKTETTQLTAKSTSTLVHFEALPPFTAEKLASLVKEAADLVQSFCGGEVKVSVLDRKNLSVEF